MLPVLVSLLPVPVIVAPAPIPAPDPEVQAGVESTLRALEAAAMAGDTDAWLRHIAPGDPEWTKEQTYFANELRKKPPEKLALKIENLAEVDGDAVGLLTFTWNMPGKPQRNVSFKARFAPVDGRYLYAGETWQHHEAPGVLVLHDPGLEDVAARVVEAFSEVRPKVDAFFAHENSPFSRRTQKIKLYATMSHLQQSICLNYEDSLSGWNEPDESIKLLVSQRTSVRALRTLLAHEYGHVATFAMGPLANDTMPWWVLEGVAELCAAEVAGGRSPDRRVESWARQDNLAPWLALADFDTIDHKWYGHVYVQGHHMLRYIETRWGRKGRLAWLRAMGEGRPLDDATRQALGLSFDQLDADWRASLPKPEKDEERKEEPAPAGT
jgi:hypothetical protein